MTNAQYDRLKFIALLIAPIVVFIATIINTWGIPYGEQIIATLSAFDVLIGAIVKISADRYNNEADE